MPMVGRTIFVDGKAVGIACSREAAKYCKCGRRETKLCDFPLTGKKSGKTCDASLCERCATRVGPNKDYCPAHANLAKSGGTQP